MTQWVLIKDIAKEMSKHAPPGWCKLALHGAIHTFRVDLYSGRGHLRAYFPPYHLSSSGSSLPPLLKRQYSPEEAIERYGLQPDQMDHSKEITIWAEDWNEEPWRIAQGWDMFTVPWDWDAPSLTYESFELPYDFVELFGYDDLHAEGEPDGSMYYDGKFDDLCLTLDDAESIAPMCDFEPHIFGSKTNAPTRKIGRPKRSGFESADEPIVRQMLQDKKANPDLSGRNLAEKYVGQAVGHGTEESRIKRLERRLRAYGI